MAVALLYTGLLSLLPRPSPKKLRRIAAAFAAAAVVFLGALAASPAVRERWMSVAGFLAQPGSYLESDRGTYLLNTVHMALHRPFGVGLGDWQTHYPVYRHHRREVAFTDEFQVRRAHSDHVQILGEGGWPGLLLWIAWLAVLIGGSARRHLDGNPRALFYSAQLVALAAAMATDYVVEMPYHKLQFFLVTFLALAPAAEPSAENAPLRQRPAAWLKACAITVITAGIVVYHAGLLSKMHLAARIERLYVQATDELAAKGRVATATLEDVLVLGARYDTRLGVHKTLHRDDLILAHTALLLDRRDLARELGLRALQRHPYSPNALRLMSRIETDPQAAETWRQAYEHVMDDAVTGFHLTYPVAQGR